MLLFSNHDQFRRTTETQANRRLQRGREKRKKSKNIAMTAFDPEASLVPTPSIEEITSAYDEILEHNSQHTGRGAGLGRIYKAMLSAQDNGQDTSTEVISTAIKTSVENAVVAGDMNGDLLGIFHDDVFMRAGVKIGPFGQYNTDSAGKASSSTELTPLVENTTLYTEFLQKLQPEDVQNETAEQFLGDVIQNLLKVTGIGFNTEVQKDVPLEDRAALAEVGQDALRTFVTIDPEYARLGLDGVALHKRTENISPELSEFLSSRKSRSIPAEIRAEYRSHKEAVARVKTYEGMQSRVNYWGRNLLPEFLIAQSGQYLTAPKEQGFGPAEWHKDGGQHHWNDALNFVMSLETEERTKPFADEVKTGLVTSLDVAIAEIDANDAVYFKAQKDDLQNIRNALTGAAYDHEQLEKYVIKPDY
jgi:hypothetical protein